MPRTRARLAAAQTLSTGRQLALVARSPALAVAAIAVLLRRPYFASWLPSPSLAALLRSLR
jgi:hypothetical protein